MRKQSYHKAIKSSLSSPLSSRSLQKLPVAVNLINRVIAECISVPDGYYRCPVCKGKPLSVLKRKGSLYIHGVGECRTLTLCKMCKGAGIIDFITNARPIQENGPGHGHWVPDSILWQPKLDVASTIFFNHVFRNHHFEEELSFDFRNTRKRVTKQVNEFVTHFLAYKRKRDFRKQFMDKHFADLKRRVLKITKTPEVKGKNICSACHSQPFGIEWVQYEDTIQLEVCGKCYGDGYQTVKDARGTGNYLFPIEHANYLDKSKMLQAILHTAEITRGAFYLMLDKVRQKTTKKGTRRTK